MHMNNLNAFILPAGIAIIFATAALAGHIPGKEEGKGEEGVVRIFAGTDSYSLMGEAKGGFRDGTDEGYGSLTLGPYVRLHENLKAGAFYRVQRGERHDDDWGARNSVWEWRDTASRNEHLLMGDVTPRALLPFLPGRNWVLEIKSRYMYNFANDEQTVTVRPGLMYVLFLGGSPLLNFFIQYELYFPLNYGTRTIYEQWAYAGIIFHVSEPVQAGLYGSYGKVTWGPSDDFERLHPGEKYEITSEYLTIGLMAVIRVRM